MLTHIRHILNIEMTFALFAVSTKHPLEYGPVPTA